MLQTETNFTGGDFKESADVDQLIDEFDQIGSNPKEEFKMPPKKAEYASQRASSGLGSHMAQKQ